MRKKDEANMEFHQFESEVGTSDEAKSIDQFENAVDLDYQFENPIDSNYQFEEKGNSIQQFEDAGNNTIPIIPSQSNRIDLKIFVLLTKCSKYSIFVLVGVIVTALVFINLPVENKPGYSTQGIPSDTPPDNQAAPTDTPPDNQAAPTGLAEEQRWQNQQQELESLGCRPKPEKYEMQSLLDSTDPTKRMVIEPAHVSVNQCSVKTSYCPLNQKCIPTTEMPKELIISVFDSQRLKKYYEVKNASNIMEHLACSCQIANLPSTTTEIGSYKGSSNAVTQSSTDIVNDFLKLHADLTAFGCKLRRSVMYVDSQLPPVHPLKGRIAYDQKFTILKCEGYCHGGKPCCADPAAPKRRRMIPVIESHTQHYQYVEVLEDRNCLCKLD